MQKIRPLIQPTKISSFKEKHEKADKAKRKAEHQDLNSDVTSSSKKDISQLRK